MSMSKKDFEEIAHRILVCVEDSDTRIDLANSLSDYFKTTNPNFDRRKFWEAVVIGAGK